MTFFVSLFNNLLGEKVQKLSIVLSYYTLWCSTLWCSCSGISKIYKMSDIHYILRQTCLPSYTINYKCTKLDSSHSPSGHKWFFGIKYQSINFANSRKNKVWKINIIYMEQYTKSVHHELFNPFQQVLELTCNIYWGCTVLVWRTGRGEVSC